AGIAGDLFAHLNNLVSPDSFPFSLSLFFLAAVIVGGLASLWGSVLGAILLVIADTQTTGLPGFEPLVVGALVVGILLLFPAGLAALPRRILSVLPVARRRPPTPPLPEDH
ncbi:MAG: ABC transporter permease subunit, partial [Acidimicrobiales bacterium]